MIGFDSTARIDPVALKAAGCVVVFRYTTRPDWPKSIARPEVAELRAAAMPLACNFESTADRMRGAGPAGHADAAEQSGNLTALGIPPTAVRSWFSADWDVQPGEVADVLDYLHAAADVLGGKQYVGCYGGLRAVQAAADAGFAIWQTVAWSGGRWDPRAVARQTGEQRYVGGVQVDVNQINDLAGLGAWGGPAAGGDMELTDKVTVSAGFAQRYPAAVPDGFAANVQIPVSTLLLGSALRAVNNEHLLIALADAVAALASKAGQAPTVDVAALAAALDLNALGAAIAGHQAANPGATADSIAVAVVGHLAAVLMKGAAS